MKATLVSIGTALLIVTGFLLSSKGMPLSTVVWAGAILFLAVEQDVRRRRIHNWLTFPALVGALALATADGGLAGLGQALSGAGLAFVVLFVPFAARILGAGDVKAVMALGALFGPAVLLSSLWWMVVAGGLLALARVTLSGALIDMGHRWLLSLKLTVLSRSWTYLAPEPGSAAAGGIPFAVAIGLGTIAYQIFGPVGGFRAWL